MREDLKNAMERVNSIEEMEKIKKMYDEDAERKKVIAEINELFTRIEDIEALNAIKLVAIEFAKASR